MAKDKDHQSGTVGYQDLVDAIATQRQGCEGAGSPLYAEILAAVGGDAARGGASARLLEPYRHRPLGDAVVLRLLAAVHELVLAGEGPDLARHYPSVGGSLDVATVGESFLAVVRRHEADLAPMLTRGVQTNDVGRSVPLLVGLLEIAAEGAEGMELRLLEVGASAGLNLWLDRFRVEAGGTAIGPLDSPVRFVEPFTGSVPDLSGPLRIEARRGCDLAPIDPSTTAGRRRLRALVWPDHSQRRARLDAALSMVQGCPIGVEEVSSAGGWVERELAEPVPGVVRVVMHSIVWQYLSDRERDHLRAVIVAAGERADRRSPVAWLGMEPDGGEAAVRIRVWPGAASREVARSTFHGPATTLVGPLDTHR